MVTAPNPGPPIVGADWLAEHFDQVTVADVRWYLDGRSGYDAYLARHLPGAIFVDLDRYLSGPPAADAGRHPLPTPAAFAAGMSSLGISDGATVVGYDDDGGRTAARLVWLLRATGHAASLLDGGIQAWPGPYESGGEGPSSKSQGSSGRGGIFPTGESPAGQSPAGQSPTHLSLSGQSVSGQSLSGQSLSGQSLSGQSLSGQSLSGQPPSGQPPAHPWPAHRLASATEVASAAIVLDARAPERYRGEVEPIDARAGHIPGARNAPTAGNLDDHGRFKSPDELRAWYEDLGVTPGSSPVVYCGSGVTACHDLLALEWAGFDGGRLYPGSWSQWSADPDRPVETG
jgi:thiosulfate/3-mercaptopyruvate sulfurtransferase